MERKITGKYIVADKMEGDTRTAWMSCGGDGLSPTPPPPGEVYNKRTLKNRSTATGPIIYPYHGTIVAAADVPDSLLGLSPISLMGVGAIFF